MESGIQSKRGERMMDKETYIRAILECNFAGFKDEIIDIAVKRIMEYEPKRGRWIFDKERLGYWISTCSECGHIFHGNEVLIYKPKFCANCGARMDEVEEDV